MRQKVSTKTTEPVTLTGPEPELLHVQGFAGYCNVPKCFGYRQAYKRIKSHTQTFGHRAALLGIRTKEPTLGDTVLTSTTVDEISRQMANDKVFNHAAEAMIPPPSAEPGDSKTIGAANYMPDLESVFESAAVVPSNEEPVLTQTVLIKFDDGLVIIDTMDGEFHAEVTFKEFLAMVHFAWNVYKSMGG